MTALEPPPMNMDPEYARKPAVRTAWWPGFVGKWWFWGGLGLVALMAIGASVAILTGDDDAGYASPSEAPLIKAGPEPIKLRPEQPGGMEVPNRDKLVYRRLEGLTEPPAVEKLLPEPEEPMPPPRAKPLPEPENAAAEAEPASSSGMAAATVEPPPTPHEQNLSPPISPPAEPPPADQAPAAVKAAAPSSAYQVQLVAVSKSEQAEDMWNKLRSKHPDVFADLEPNVERADLGKKGVMYRLRAGPLDSEAKARSVCADLARRKVDCLVVRPGG